MTYFMENVVIADKLHCGSEHDHFDSDEDIMPATLSITSGQEETGWWLQKMDFFKIVYFIVSYNNFITFVHNYLN